MAEWSERPHIRVAELAGPAPSDQLSRRLSKGTRKFRGKELDLDAEIIEESRRCAREDAGLILSRAVDPARLGGPTPVRDAGPAADRHDAHKIQQVARRKHLHQASRQRARKAGGSTLG